MTSPYYFDQTVADAAVDFFPRFLRHVKGEWFNRPFELSPADAHDIRQVFGWRRRADGYRRYRRFHKWVPRKNGKTIGVAGIGHLMTVGDGEMGAETYSHAVDKNQSAISYTMAAQMVALSPSLRDLYEVTKTGMMCPNTMSFWQPLSGEAFGKHGLNAHCLLGDEAHEWRSDRLHTFLRQSMGARRQPLDVIISTAGLREGYGWELYQESVKIRDGVIDDPETYVAIHEADEKDDWTSPDVWRKANPNLGISISLEYLAAECKKAQQSARLENDFRRYHLNQWVSQAVRWLQMEAWRQCTAEPNNKNLWRELRARLKGKRCFGGLDLASIKDICAWVLVFPVQDGVPVTTILPFFFVPADTVELRTRRDRVPYERWCSERVGAIKATPGNVTDYAFIREQIFSDFADYRIEKVGVDAYNATHLSTELMAEGVPLEFIRQGFLTLSPPSKELERLVVSQQLEHGNHEVLEWMADNVQVIGDPAGNIKPVKDKENSPRKIDGISATVNALALAMVEPKPQVSVYETRGILEVDL
jgi:phage terminase large subunit-like protein